MCSMAVILDDDFSGATFRGIGYMLGIGPASLENAQVYGNTLGEGVSFHAQILPYSGSRWFLNQNHFRNGSNTVPAFLDLVASSAHLSN